MSANEKSLKPNELLFTEGDQSNSLYFIKRGVVRVFKQKQEGTIEIETIRAGQLLGELSFLDNQPRSASAEAVTTIEYIEISRSTLDEALAKLPEWFMAMVKTVTSRLRAANNKIRALESVNTEYEVDRHGNRSREFTYINTSELLRFCTGLLAVSVRYGKPNASGVNEFPLAILERFVTQILQVGSSKTLHLVEVFKTVGLLSGDLVLTDVRFLDQFISFVNEQNLAEPSKKRTLTATGFAALLAFAPNIAHAEKVDEGKSKLNIAPALEKAGLALTHLQELSDQKVVQNVLVLSTTEVVVEFDPSKFETEYKTFWILNEISKLNTQRRKA